MIQSKTDFFLDFEGKTLSRTLDDAVSKTLNKVKWDTPYDTMNKEDI